MSKLFSFSGYLTKCVIEFLFRQLSLSKEKEKEGRTGMQKNEYLENQMSFLDETKSLFHSF